MTSENKDKLVSETTIFRNQHDKLSKMASDISERLSIDQLSSDATEVRHLLSELLGHLEVHLVMEDKSLYPSLLDCSDDKIKSMARRFINEMGDIGEALKAYRNKWKSVYDIQDNPRDFVDHTKVIFNALIKRMEKENTQLYAAVDAL